MLQQNGQIFEMARNGGYINDVDNTSVSIGADLTLLAGDKIFIAARQLNLLSLPSPFIESIESNYFSGHLVFPF